jgi:hypothetical protein
VENFAKGSKLWPGEAWRDIQHFGTVKQGDRVFEEYRFVPADGSAPFLPVGFLFDKVGTPGQHVTVYSDHHLVEDRGPILKDREDIHPWTSEEDVLHAYFKALNGNQLEAVLDVFEPDGYFQHSNAETFTGREGLKKDFTKMMGSSGIRVRYCRFTDDGRTVACEVYMPSGRPAIALYERGRPGKLKAIRIYM